MTSSLYEKAAVCSTNCNTNNQACSVKVEKIRYSMVVQKVIGFPCFIFNCLKNHMII